MRDYRIHLRVYDLLHKVKMEMDLCKDVIGLSVSYSDTLYMVTYAAVYFCPNMLITRAIK